MSGRAMELPDGWTRPDYADDTMMPPPEDYRESPGFYAIITKKGQILTAFPEYGDKDDMLSWDMWKSPGVRPVWPSDVVAYKKLDLPYAIIRELLESPDMTSKTFRKIYGSTT